MKSSLCNRKYPLKLFKKELSFVLVCEENHAPCMCTLIPNMARILFSSLLAPLLLSDIMWSSLWANSQGMTNLIGSQEDSPDLPRNLLSASVQTLFSVPYPEMASRNAIRIGVILDNPFSDQCALQHTCRHGGLAFDAAKLMCGLLHLNCTFLNFDSYDYGRVDESGNLTGLLRAVRDGQFDTTLPFITATYDRSQSVHFSEGVFFFDNVLVTKMPKKKEEVQLDWNIVKSFEWPVWFAFIIAFLCSQLVMTAVEHLRYREWKHGIRPTVPFDFESHKRRYDRASDRLVYMVFSILEFMFTCSYAGIMYSNQVAGKETLPFVDLDTFIECLAARKCSLIAPTLSYSSYEFFKAQGGIRLARILEENPPSIVSMQLIPDTIMENEAIFLTWLIPKLFYTTLTKNNRDCKFYDVTVPFFDVNTFPVRKDDWYLRDILDNGAALLQQHGLLASIESRYQVNVDLCDQVKSISSARSMRVLTIRSIQAALTFYACATVTSLVVFGLERAIVRSLTRSWRVTDSDCVDGETFRPHLKLTRVEVSQEISAEIHL